MSSRLVSALVALSVTLFAIVATSVHLSYAYLRASGAVESEVQTTYLHVPQGDAREVESRITMRAGSLLVSSGANGLLEVTAATNVVGLEPVVRYDEDAGHGMLLVEQAASQNDQRLALLADAVSTWNVRLGGDDLVHALALTVYAGDAVLDLRGVSLARGHVFLRSGTLEVALDQSWEQDTTIEIMASTGTTTVYLPNDTGVLVTADEGLGTITWAGLWPYGDHQGTYVNAAYGKTPVTLTLALEMGLGRANLVVR